MQTITSRFRHWRRWTLFMLMSVTPGLQLVVGATFTSVQAQKASVEDERARRAAEMEQRAKEIRVFPVRENDRLEVPRHERPLLRFSDPSRDFFDGTLWAWGTSGRPVAVVTLERYKSFWSYELVSLVEDGIAAQLPDGRRWVPSRPGLEWQAFPDAAAPAEVAAQRLRQMKALAERLSAVERVPEGDCVLRLMPTPIYRYSDRQGGALDGALFIFVYGTNPEVLVVLECRGGEVPVWYFSPSRLTTALVTVRLDGRAIWTKPALSAPNRLHEPYMSFVREGE
jgi:hypothetical protein